jgi:hypothetical protein
MPFNVRGNAFCFRENLFFCGLVHSYATRPRVSDQEGRIGLEEFYLAIRMA